MTLISLVANELKTQMESSPLFPFSNRSNYPPSKQFKPHMKNVALKNNPIVMVSPEIEYFEIGNEESERKAPQYHILEDAKVIRNPNKGTPQSLGSQRNIKNRGKRDYGRNIYVKKGSGEIQQEYRRAFKKRSNIWEVNTTLALKKFNARNEKRSYRYNDHFGYIERILEDITPIIAEQINAKLRVGSDFELEFEQLENVYINENFEEESVLTPIDTTGDYRDW